VMMSFAITPALAALRQLEPAVRFSV